MSKLSYLIVICVSILLGAWSGIALCDWLAPMADYEVELAKTLQDGNSVAKSSRAYVDEVDVARSVNPTFHVRNENPRDFAGFRFER